MPSGSIQAFLKLRLINNRTDRIERIIGSHVELRKRNLLFGKTTIAVARVSIIRPGPGLVLDGPEIQNIELKPMSEPYEIAIAVSGEIEESVIVPKRADLVLVLDMVGPIPRLERHLTTIIFGKRPASQSEKDSNGP